MIKETTVAGIFLERDGAHLLRSKARKISLNEPWEFDFIDQMKVKWNPNDPNEAREGLNKLGSMIRDVGSDLKSVAVASYGPFVSLDRDNDRYGEIHNSTADSPLTGFKLKDILRESFGQKMNATSGPILTFHTDADACALGEAFERKIKNNEILGYLCVTEGVGFGLVRGREILRSALHPEIGLIHIRLMPDDPLIPTHSHIQYAGGLEQYAANKSLYERFSKLTSNNSPKFEDIIHYHDDKLWDIRAYYIAQACLACTTVFPPHFLVVSVH